MSNRIGENTLFVHAIHLALWELAAFGVVLVLINRWLINWADGPVKRAAMASAGMLCATSAGAAALMASPTLTALPGLLLIGFALGEVRRVLLRRKYRPWNHVVVSDWESRLSRPVTTTDLAITRCEVVANLASSRIRIVQLTDLHFSRALPSKYFDQVLEVVRREAPDVLVLTGDFISNIDNLPVLKDWLSKLPRPRLGTFAVLGNHDYWAKASESLRAALAELGIQWIAGRCQPLAAATNRPVFLCGTEAPRGPGSRMKGVKSSDYVVMLSHTPDNVYALSQAVDLMFAGHVHGGQWRLPWLGSLVVPSRYGRRLDRGQFQIGRTRLFISAGIGVDAPHLRLYCPPEIVVVDLV